VPKSYKRCASPRLSAARLNNVIVELARSK
jgi:hypothetical protein